jgi:FkbM family methyltransferase
MKTMFDLDFIADNYQRHDRRNSWWIETSNQIEEYLSLGGDELELSFFQGENSKLFKLRVPWVEMGAVTSHHLFGLDEIILFSFYLRNQERYRRAVDLGANIGVHSAVLGSLGLEVIAYEPDPSHSVVAQGFIKSLGQIPGNIRWVEKAVVPVGSEKSVEFVRVLGNTTSSHVAGAKEPYGELERFQVESEDVVSALTGADLVKMDVEGLEAKLLSSLLEEISIDELPDIIMEIGNPYNAKKILDLAETKNLTLFSQQVNWNIVEDLRQMPKNYKEGSVFMTSKGRMIW